MDGELLGLGSCKELKHIYIRYFFLAAAHLCSIFDLAVRTNIPKFLSLNLLNEFK